MKRYITITIMLFFNCFPVSINPAHTPNQIVKDSSLIGTWNYSKDNTKEEVFDISWKDSNTYFIRNASVDPEVKYFGTYSAQLTQINNDLILSITLYSNKVIDTNNLAGYLAVPSYFFAKLVHIKSDSVVVKIIDYDWIVQQIKRQKQRLKTAEYNKKLILVETPEKTRDFLSRCLKETKHIKYDTIILWRNK